MVSAAEIDGPHVEQDEQAKLLMDNGRLLDSVAVPAFQVYVQKTLSPGLTWNGRCHPFYNKVHCTCCADVLVSCIMGLARQSG